MCTSQVVIHHLSVCFCFADIKDCLINPCKNNGTCVDRPGYFQCICPAGFEGPLCTDGNMINFDDNIRQY